MISFRSMFFAWVFALFSFFSVDALASTYFETNCGAGVQQGSAEEISAYICTHVEICMGSAFSQGSYSRHEIHATSPRTLKSYCNYYAFGNWSYDGLSTKDAYEQTVSQCPAGLVEVNGVCMQPPPCPLPGVTAWNTNDSEAVETNAGSSVGTICDNTGCGIEPMGTEMVLPSGGGKEMHFIQWARYTGERPATCNSSWVPPSGDVTDYTPAADTPDGVPNSQEDCPAGSAFGQVNGVNVCAPAGSKINYVPESGTSSDGGSSETKRTDTVNEDGSVTTTTTNVNNGSTTTTNVTNNYGGASFGAGGTGSDPTSINLGPAPPAESGDVTVDLPGPGSGVDGAGTAQRDFTVSGHFSGAGGCIADRTISAMGVDVVIPLSELCPWFDVVSKILTIVSVFLAMRILVMS